MMWRSGDRVIENPISGHLAIGSSANDALMIWFLRGPDVLATAGETLALQVLGWFFNGAMARSPDGPMISSDGSIVLLVVVARA